MEIHRVPRSWEELARIVFMALAFGITAFESVVCQGPTEIANLPIHIPTSLPFYEGEDIVVDKCLRDEVAVNGTCYGLLTQGPCPPSEIVLLDPHTYESFCAPRLCAPDRIFVFNDQLCHDPFSSPHCSGELQLFQTAFGTPICQCPDGFLEAGMGMCQPTLTPHIIECPPNQVCGVDPCGGLNLRRPLSSPPFVPSLNDDKCYQLGQVEGVCPRGTFYSLNVELHGGECARLTDAGYIILDEETQRLYQDLYGPFTMLAHTMLGPVMSPPPLPFPQDSDNMLAATKGTLMDQTIGQQQQSGQAGEGGRTHGVDGTGHGAALQVSSHSGSVATHITFGNIPTRGPVGKQIVFPGPQVASQPIHRGHYIRGHNLGPTRYYKFDSLSKHFLPTHADLARLHATPGQNHLVRHFHNGGFHGATAPITVNVVPNRLLTQTIINRNIQLINQVTPTRIIFPSDTREDTEGQESHEQEQQEQEKQEKQEQKESVADSEAQEENGGNNDEAETSSRRRRAVQEAGLVETRLVTCRPGAREHINAKCLHLLLPFSALPANSLQSSIGVKGVLKRSVRSASPLVPTQSCPQGTAFDLRRKCSLIPSATVSVNALGL